MSPGVLDWKGCHYEPVVLHTHTCTETDVDVFPSVLYPHSGFRSAHGERKRPEAMTKRWPRAHVESGDRSHGPSHSLRRCPAGAGTKGRRARSAAR